MTGTTDHSEYRPWTAQKRVVDFSLNTTEEIENLIREQLSAGLNTSTIDNIIASRFNSTSDSELWADYFKLVTDIRTLCPLRNLARRAAAHFAEPVSLL